jgi:hypothetical protein
MTEPAGEIIRSQLAFLAELGKLKSIVRQSPLINRSRRVWHDALHIVAARLGNICSVLPAKRVDRR